MSGEFKCALCQGVFEKSWSDGDAMKEAKGLWRAEDLEDTETVCDYCFKLIQARIADYSEKN